jgi:hypothetical protein
VGCQLDARITERARRDLRPVLRNAPEADVAPAQLEKRQCTVVTAADVAARAAVRSQVEVPRHVSMAKARGFQIDYKGSNDVTKELWDSYRRFEPLVKKLDLK